MREQDTVSQLKSQQLAAQDLMIHLVDDPRHSSSSPCLKICLGQNHVISTLPSLDQVVIFVPLLKNRKFFYHLMIGQEVLHPDFLLDNRTLKIHMKKCGSIVMVHHVLLAPDHQL